MKTRHMLPTILLMAPSLVLANDLQDSWTKKKEQSPWSGYISVDYSRNGYEDSASVADRSASATGVLRYAVTDTSRVQLVVSGYHAFDGDTYGDRGQFFGNTSLSWARNGIFEPTENSSVSSELRLIFPTSKVSQRDDLQVGARGKLRWFATLDDWAEGLSVSNSLLVRKNFHKYKTSGSRILNEYSVSNQFTVDYSFAEDFYFSVYVMPRKTWNYYGNSHNSHVSHGEEIGYQLNKNVSFSVGITNGVSYYNPDRGPNPLNDLIDLKEMTYFAVANYQF